MVIKESMDLESSGLTQRAVAAFLEAGKLPAHLATLRASYRARRDAMLLALESDVDDIKPGHNANHSRVVAALRTDPVFWAATTSAARIRFFSS